MAVINPVGTVSPLWREQVVANPPQVSTITAGGASSGSTVTIGTNQTGIFPGMLVTFSVGTPEPVNTVVLSYVAATGVVTFAAPLTNAHTSGNLQWGYGAPVYDANGFMSSQPGGAQTPNTPNALPSTAYGVNQRVRDWDMQLRQQCVYT